MPRALSRATILAMGGACLLAAGCEPEIPPPKDDSERAWGIAPSGLYQETGIALMFAGENDSDYFTMRCAINFPSKIFVSVNRFWKAPRGEAVISNKILNAKLISVPETVWVAGWKNEFSHQFEVEIEQIQDIFQGVGDVIVSMTHNIDSVQRNLPLKGDCPVRFVELCKQIWLDPTAPDDRRNYSCR